MTKEEPNKPDQTVPMRSIISRPWLVRIVIILTVLVGYGIWSLYDAFVAYPERGEAYASSREWVYLDKVIEADKRESPGVLRREAAVPDPVAEFARLRMPETQQRNAEDAQGGGRRRRAQMEQARLEWLTALSRIGRLHPAYTGFYVEPDPVVVDRIAALEARAGELSAAERSELDGLKTTATRHSPHERFGILDTRWTTESPPGPLQSYDIPVNKISAGACFLFALYLIYLFVIVATKTYQWDPAESRFTLPSGESIVPDDLEDVDKRKWDKFIVFLKIKDNHKTLGGAELRFDTYRHGYIEDWILTMEKAAFPERAEEVPGSPEPAADLSESEHDSAVGASGHDDRA
ncbi:MAG: hypothetical protein K8E66_01465 [Phycisphaerales bacterium]|nr:hypothetical protein [Phycisphaerales bacterium]